MNELFFPLLPKMSLAINGSLSTLRPAVVGFVSNLLYEDVSGEIIAHAVLAKRNDQSQNFID